MSSGAPLIVISATGVPDAVAQGHTLLDHAAHKGHLAAFRDQLIRRALADLSHRTGELTKRKRSVRVQYRIRVLIWGRATNRSGRFGLVPLSVGDLFAAAVERRVAHDSVIDEILLQRQLLQDGRAGYTHDVDSVRQAVRGHVPTGVIQRSLLDVWQAPTHPSRQHQFRCIATVVYLRTHAIPLAKKRQEGFWRQASSG